MSALRVLVSASTRQRPPRRRSAAWILAVAGPLLITLGSLPFRSSFGLAGVLFGALMVVVAVAVIGGTRPALTSVGIGLLAAAFVFARPFGGLAFRPGDGVALVGFVVVGAGLGFLVAEFVVLAEQRGALLALEAALRRVATVVARGSPPDQVFAVVIEEVGELLPVDIARLCRYEPDGTMTFLGAWGRAREHYPVGSQWMLGGKNLSTLVAQTGHPARIDSYLDVSGPLAANVRETGVRSGVATPIIVEGRLWGVMAAGSCGEEPLPADTEARLAAFTELLATAIANAESRAGLARLAEEQTALRRVATLVARAAPPEDVFAVVTEEVGRLLNVEFSGMGRYESAGTLTFIAASSRTGKPFPVVGSRLTLGGKNVSTLVFESARPARVDCYAGASGPVGLTARETGFRSSVGTPIVVEGSLWGVVIVGSTLEQPLPTDTEARLASFTGLVATAIANAESRAALAASRSRVVAAADEARRRIERDLHDGAQQRLVTLGLELRAAQAAVPQELGELRGELSRFAAGLASMQNELREIARGIHPAILTEGGLGPALKALARRSPIPVECDVRLAARLPERVEVAAHYVVSEALTNAAKHARATVVHVDVDEGDGFLRLGVRDDGSGGAQLIPGSGLVGLKDRVEALGGTIVVQSPLGTGTTVYAELPLAGSSSGGNALGPSG